MALDPLDRRFGSDQPFAQSGRHTPSSGGDVLRFVVAPLAVTFLLAGGVYWLKQTASGPPVRPSAAIVTVQLLTAPAQQIHASPAPQQAVAAPGQGVAKRPEPDPPRPPAIEPSPTVPDAPAVETRPPLERPTTMAFAAAPPDLLLDSVTAQFRRALSERLAQFKRYPQDARRVRAEGTAVVRFTIGRDGWVSAVTLTSSTGDAALDREALATVTRAQPLPRIPAELPGRMALTVPINFSLR